MSRTLRFFDLLQRMRCAKYPVTATTLAADLNVSVRTVYRDLASLQQQGANIVGEPGLGYVLRPGFILPPLMFLENEINALMLGIRWVKKNTDPDLQQAATNLLVKINAVLPPHLREALETAPLLIGSCATPNSDSNMRVLRSAIHARCKIQLEYRDLQGAQSTRIVWPFAIGYFDQVQLLVAWCEQRQDYRHFRIDRIHHLQQLAGAYPRSRQALLKAWRERKKMSDDY